MISTFVASQTARRACAGVGALLVLLGLYWIYSVESAQRARVAALDAIGGPVVELSLAGIAGADAEDALVRVSGAPVVAQPLRDAQFGVVAASPVLQRHVEMLQWREVDTGMGPPRYVREWVSHPIDSSRFANPERHVNPGSFPIPALRFTAADVRIDGVKLGAEIVDAIPGSVPLPPTYTTLPANLTASFQLHDGALYSGHDPRSPTLGDLRVSWHTVPSRVLTVLGLLRDGVLSAAPGLPAPGFIVLVDDVDLNGALPGLPNAPRGIWWQRLLALALTWVGAMLARFGLHHRRDTLVAAALAVAPLALMGAVIWVGTRWLAALALLILVIAAAALAWQRWRATT